MEGLNLVSHGSYLRELRDEMGKHHIGIIGVVTLVVFASCKGEEPAHDHPKVTARLLPESLYFPRRLFAAPFARSMRTLAMSAIAPGNSSEMASNAAPSGASKQRRT